MAENKSSSDLATKLVTGIGVIGISALAIGCGEDSLVKPDYKSQTGHVAGSDDKFSPRNILLYGLYGDGKIIGSDDKFRSDSKRASEIGESAKPSYEIWNNGGIYAIFPSGNIERVDRESRQHYIVNVEGSRVIIRTPNGERSVNSYTPIGENSSPAKYIVKESDGSIFVIKANATRTRIDDKLSGPKC